MGIVECLKEGMSTKDIADAYNISESTVRGYIQQIKKFGIPHNKKG